MRKVFVPGVILAMGATALTGCGDENTTKVTESTGMQMVESGDSMPECGQESQGQIIYVADSTMVYYCADEEWIELGTDVSPAKDGTNGSDGKDGSSCTAEPIENGFDIVCGGKSVGTILNGSDGTQGEDGTSCSMTDDGNGTVTVTCGEGDDAVSSTFYKSVCGTTPYDISAQFCYMDQVFFRCGSYDYTTHFCDPRDTTFYRYVTVGSQVWMAENLNYAYLEPTADEDSSSFCYNDDPAYCETYGRLYLWSAAMDSVGKFSKSGRGCGNGATCSSSGNVRGVCPEGWHLPSKDEFETLVSTAGGLSVAGYKLKSFREEYWLYRGSDVFGFSVLPAGAWLSFYDRFVFNGNIKSSRAYFWGSTYSEDGVSNLYIDNLDTAHLTPYLIERNAFSIRCLKD